MKVTDLHTYFPFLKELSRERNPEGETLSTKKLYPYREKEYYENLPPEKKKLYDVAVEFQSLFVKLYLNSLRKTTNPENDLLYGGRVQEIFEDLLYDEYAKIYSRNSDLPIAKAIYHQYEKFLNENPSSQLEQELEKLKHNHYRKVIENPLPALEITK